VRNTPGAVLFDLDDTLADTAGTLVIPAQKRAVVAMVEAGLRASVEEAHAALLEIRKLDPGVPFFRRLIERFGADDAEACREAGRGAFFGNPPDAIRLVPGARRLLTVLRERGVRLFLVTYGVPARQEQKIDLLGIRECFEEVVVVPLTEAPDKREVFSGILDRLGVPPAEVWVVGDRPPGEIRAGNALGAFTIRIRRGEFFGLEPRDASEEAGLTLESLDGLIAELRG